MWTMPVQCNNSSTQIVCTVKLFVTTAMDSSLKTAKQAGRQLLKPPVTNMTDRT